jgi:hypothetical protein
MTQAVYPNPAAAFPGPQPVDPSLLPYATPAPPRVGPRASAGAAILAAGVLLVGLGGCFLIGVMVIVDPSAGSRSPAFRPDLTTAETGLVLVLYLCTFMCFGGAATVLFFGTRAILRVMRGTHS